MNSRPNLVAGCAFILVAATANPVDAQVPYPTCADFPQQRASALRTVAQAASKCVEEIQSTGSPRFRCSEYREARETEKFSEQCWLDAYEYFAKAEDDVPGYKTPPDVAAFIKYGSSYMKAVTLTDDLLAVYP